MGTNNFSSLPNELPKRRYYGKSLPFGEKSFTGNNIGLMTIEQALADYAFFLKGFKKTLKAEKCPVVAFGGSYGGMLATYMRLKYPNIIIGAIAASAPIYIEKLSGNVFFQGVTKSFHDASPECEATVRSAFNQLQKWSELGKKGYSEIAQTFYLCEPLKNAADYEYLLRWIRNAFLTAALMNYPYATQFMGNFPAYPVKVMCNRLQSAVRPSDGLYAASALFYNATQDLPCFDIYNEYVYCSDPTGCGLGNDAIAWDYLACVEFNSEMETNGVTDMFPVLKFNSSMRDHHCLNTFNVVPRRDIMDVEYWGDDITPASNIVFSNGNMDPCAAGGVLQNISDSLVAVIVDGGAHHLDLREDNPLDPQSVRDARNFELANIEKWLRDYYHWNK
ncbi:hypothetical protein JTE90_007882 [Oedothorax gibbosus]|uniref:Lysosomal Pro-X carboxypeptidase n=1 Tax=Oedothorax gibbosus TaxID=931172 RepID=A0AAV6VI69_9ARAC|nr:hypothetical protein JTE90_007882 [Oedothorax gibbosus]